MGDLSSVARRLLMDKSIRTIVSTLGKSANSQRMVIPFASAWGRG